MYNIEYIINKIYNDIQIKNINDFKKILKEIFILYFPNISYNDDNLLIINYICYYNEFVKCEDRDLFYISKRNSIDKTIMAKHLLNLYNTYEYIYNLKQPVQKSKEWYDMRNNMITASNCASAIGKSKYNPIKEILLDKLGEGKKYQENKNVYHGKLYEKIAVMIYENIYNTKIGDFGLIPHKNIPYIGASPDGISMTLTLDGKLNKLLGRMIEIKCPTSRKILNYGTLVGDICPEHYWIQVQVQLECCNLNECDFWQCNFTEFIDEEEYINDDNNIYYSENQLYTQDIKTKILNEPEKIQIDKRLQKGLILELIPVNKEINKNELLKWYAVNIYPNSLLKSTKEYIIWANNTINNLNNLYPEYNNNYVFNRIIYWKLNNAHNELIIRQPSWFEENKKLLELFWNRVIYYRNNKNYIKTDIIDKKLYNTHFLKCSSNRINLPDVKNIKSNPFSDSE